MTKVILDPSVRAKLHNLDGELELCDETGRTLGHFLPADRYRDLLYAQAKAAFGDEEEFEQARREVHIGGGLTTAEALAHLDAVARTARGK